LLHLGFIDIIGGAKIIVEEPKVTQQKLRQAFGGRSLDA